jgi:hypothetical protein
MKNVSMGSKKKQYRSIRLAAEAAGVPYITLYMRIRMGMPLAKAMTLPVRKYEKVKA